MSEEKRGEFNVGEMFVAAENVADVVEEPGKMCRCMRRLCIYHNFSYGTGDLEQQRFVLIGYIGAFQPADGGSVVGLGEDDIAR